MPRTLITGVAGFTGRYLATLLAGRGHEVHGLVHQRPSADVADAAIHVADLADGAAMLGLVERVRPEFVVHLAAIANVAYGDIEEMYRSNVLGTRQLLEALSKAASRPQAVVIASSANIYGNGRPDVLEETLSPAPANDYGVTKVAAEYVASIYNGRLPIIVVRPFNYTGVGQSLDYIVAKIVAHVRAKAPVIELGNLEVARDFSDVRSVVDTYAQLLETPAAIGQTFNIASGNAVTLGELVDLACELGNHRMETTVNPAFVRANEVRAICGSHAKLDSVLADRLTIPLRETLRWMLEAP